MNTGPIHPDQRLIVMYVCWFSEHESSIGSDIGRILKTTFTSNNKTCRAVQQVIIRDNLKREELLSENLSYDAMLTRDNYLPNKVRTEGGFLPIPFLNIIETENNLEDFLISTLRDKLFFKQPPRTVA